MRALLLIALCASAGSITSDIRADEEKKKEVVKEISSKGWELYFRFDPDKKDWRFGLMHGSNRLKTAQEIAASTTLDVKGLQKRLSELAAGQMVLPQGRLPDKVRKEIADHCAKEKLEFVDR